MYKKAQLLSISIELTKIFYFITFCVVLHFLQSYTAKGKINGLTGGVKDDLEELKTLIRKLKDQIKLTNKIVLYSSLVGIFIRITIKTIHDKTNVSFFCNLIFFTHALIFSVVEEKKNTPKY